MCLHWGFETSEWVKIVTQIIFTLLWGGWRWSPKTYSLCSDWNPGTGFWWLPAEEGWHGRQETGAGQACDKQLGETRGNGAPVQAMGGSRRRREAQVWRARPGGRCHIRHTQGSGIWQALWWLAMYAEKARHNAKSTKMRHSQRLAVEWRLDGWADSPHSAHA